MVYVALVVTELPQSSLAVKITVALPVAPHSSLSAVKSLVHVMLPQSSSADAPPLLSNQAFRSVVLPMPSHSTVRSMAPAVSVGSVVSSMMKLAVVVAAFPQSSVAVKITSISPDPAQVRAKSWKLLLQVTSPQRSVASPAPPLASNQALISSVLPAPSHSVVTSMAALAMLGGVVSDTLKVAVVVLVLPLPSVTVNFTVSDSLSPQSGVNPMLLWLQESGPQASVAVAPPLLASQAVN